MYPDLKGKVAVVTGAGSGLGKAIARRAEPFVHSPHVHTLSFVGTDRLLAVVDLGLDLIAIHALDAQGSVVDAPAPTVLNRWPGSSSVFEELPGTPGRGCGVRLVRRSDGETENTVEEAVLPVRPAAIVEAPIGAGPRILACHPTLPVAALICELACELILFRLDGGGLLWRPYARVDLLAEGEGRHRANAALVQRDGVTGALTPMADGLPSPESILQAFIVGEPACAQACQRMEAVGHGAVPASVGLRNAVNPKVWSWQRMEASARAGLDPEKKYPAVVVAHPNGKSKWLATTLRSLPGTAISPWPSMPVTAPSSSTCPAHDDGQPCRYRLYDHRLL